MASTKPESPAALITGSSSGIGEATARALAAEGYRIVVNSARSADAGEAVAASIDGAVYVQADIAQEADCRDLIDAAVGAFGRLDVLVNNAGYTVKIPHADLDAVTDEVFWRILQVNLLGTWYVIRAALPHLRATGAGAVVNVSSIAGQRAVGSSIPYAVSKAAVDHLTRLLANVSGPEVRVNAIAPGLVATPWTATEAFQPQHEAIKKWAPLARSAEPAEIAEAIVGVVRARYMTGEVILVDGGAALR